MEWNPQLVDQLDWHWHRNLRPRLAGLTDDEYFWEPVAGCWSVRPRADADSAIAMGSGDYLVEYEWPESGTPPVTTIAWRLAHLIVGVFGRRNADQFGGPAVEYETFDYAGTADGALAQLDGAYAAWIAGARGLGEALARPCGPAEGPIAESPFSTLILHINREAIHHSAEICLLRDLYRDRDKG